MLLVIIGLVVVAAGLCISSEYDRREVFRDGVWRKQRRTWRGWRDCP
jgi:hypothetical protein